MSLRQYKTATLALGQSSGKFPFLVANCVLECLSYFCDFSVSWPRLFWRDFFFGGRGIRLACGICPHVELLRDVFQMPLQDVSSIEGASRWESKFFRY